MGLTIHEGEFEDFASPPDRMISGQQPVLPYSTSIEAAWQVVEKMADWQGGGVFYFRLEQCDADDASREWGAQFYAWGASEPCQAPMVLADTPALAICQAALIAIGDAHV